MFLSSGGGGGGGRTSSTRRHDFTQVKLCDLWRIRLPRKILRGGGRKERQEMGRRRVDGRRGRREGKENGSELESRGGERRERKRRGQGLRSYYCGVSE